jgi:CBS domain-containing protein
MISVREIMTPRSSLYVMGPDDSVAAAGRAMSVQRIHHIPVLDEDGRLIGLVSDRDVLAATAPKRPGAPTDASGLRLRDIMTTRIETVAAGCGIRHAALRLQALGVGCLPVMEDDALAGIVTDTDFVAVAINLIEVQEEIEPVPAD